MASTTGRRVVVPLTNKSGGSVAKGDVVVLDGANDDSFTTTTTGGHTGKVGIAQATIAADATGPVLVSGEADLVNVAASVTRGDYGKTHTVAKQATSSATRGAGTFCQFKTGGTTPKAILFGQPDLATSGVAAPDVQQFSTAGNATWTKPANAVYVDVVCIGPGGGGGGGRRGAAGSLRFGGQGGGAGGYSRKRFLASDLGATEKLTVGAGGAGGAGAAVDSTNGTTGSTAPGGSWFGNSADGVDDDAKVFANGAGGGVGGGSAAGFTGAGTPGAGTENSRVHHFVVSFTNAVDQYLFASGGTPRTDAAGNQGNPFYANGGGGAGGSVDAANVERAGGAGAPPAEKASHPNANAGAVRTAGTAGATVTGETLPYAGFGGGGGGASNSSAASAGNGGAGGFPGGGGGGGGGATNGGAGVGGTGGAGSKGAAWVITHFG